MKRIAILACLLIALTAQAQENKGARDVHRAIVEFISKYSEAPHPAGTITNGDAAGGLLPNSKLHIVKTSKSSAWVGTQYLESWAFSFRMGTDRPEQPFPLRGLMKAFDRQSGHCASCYNYFIADGTGPSIFPGIMVTWGSKGDVVHVVPFQQDENVRVITFTDRDGFRSTYLMKWTLTPLDVPTETTFWHDRTLYDQNGRRGAHATYQLDGTLSWYYSPMTSAANWQMAAVADDEQPAAGGHIIVSGQEVQLNDLNIDYGPHVAYRTLLAKVCRMQQLLRGATRSEQTAIAYTLNKVCDEYTALLSPWQYDELQACIDEMLTMLTVSDDVVLATAAKVKLQNKMNRTPDMASLRAQDQAYLNAMGFHLLRHDVCHDHVTYDGQYYTGDEIVKYLDTYDSEGEQKYHAEKVVTGLQPGVYRLRVATRASGTGAFIYLLGDNGEKHLAEIPVYYTEGGNIWADARRRVHELEEQGRIGEVSGYDRRLQNANGGRGFGWNRLVLDSIVVRDGTVRYGVTTLPEFTGKPFRGTWFSACDFELERMGDLPQ